MIQRCERSFFQVCGDLKMSVGLGIPVYGYRKRGTGFAVVASPGIFAACSFYLQCVFIVLDLLITFLFFSILCMAYSFYVLEFLFLPLSHCILHHNESGNRGMCIEDVDFGCVCIFPCYV